MKQLSPVLIGDDAHLAFFCPACGELHQISYGVTNGPNWTWNGDVERPSFQPSILVRGVQTVNDAAGYWTGEWKCGPDGKALPQLCHSYVTDGQIQFLGDCLHEFAGQTVPLPPFERLDE